MAVRRLSLRSWTATSVSDLATIPVTIHRGELAFVQDEGVLYEYSGSPLTWTAVSAGATLAALSDVAIGSPLTDGDALVYDSGLGKWRNAAPSSASIATLSDVALGSPLSDGDVLTYDSGSGLWLNTPPSTPGGGGFPWTFTAPPAAASFTGDNNTGATLTDTSMGLHLAVPARSGATDICVFYKSMTHNKVTVALRANVLEKFPWYGIGFRESGSGKLHVFFREPDGFGTNTLYSYYIVGPTNGAGAVQYAAVNLYRGVGDWEFLQLEDDGANRICRYSTDFESWTQISSTGRTTDLTANNWCLVLNPHNGTWTQTMTIFSWLEE